MRPSPKSHMSGSKAELAEPSCTLTEHQALMTVSDRLTGTHYSIIETIPLLALTLQPATQRQRSQASRMAKPWWALCTICPRCLNLPSCCAQPCHCRSKHDVRFCLHAPSVFSHFCVYAIGNLLFVFGSTRAGQNSQAAQSS